MYIWIINWRDAAMIYVESVYRVCSVGSVFREMYAANGKHGMNTRLQCFIYECEVAEQEKKKGKRRFGFGTKMVRRLP